MLATLSSSATPLHNHCQEQLKGRRKWIPDTHLVCLDLFGAVLHRVAADGALEINIHGVAGWHQVVVVDGLDEGLQKDDR